MVFTSIALYDYEFFYCMSFVREDLGQWVECKNTLWFFIPFSHVIWWQLLKRIILNVNQHNIQRNDQVELIMTKFRNCCSMPLVHGVINDTYIYCQGKIIISRRLLLLKNKWVLNGGTNDGWHKKMFIDVFVAFSTTCPWAYQMVIRVHILLILDIVMKCNPRHIH